MPDTSHSNRVRKHLAFATVRKRVIRVIRRFLELDRELLRNNVAELAITHRFATLLREEFPGRDIDVNYNRHGQDVKRIQLPFPCRNWENPKRRVFPDVVVHQRECDDRNLLVIEIKKSTNPEPRECDIAKVRCFRAQLHYRYGLFLEFEAGVPDPTVARTEWQTTP